MRAWTVALLAFAVSAAPLPAQAPADLFAAARAGDVAKVRQLLEAGVPIDSTDKYGSTAIGMAAAAGHLEVVRSLLEQGADPDLPDKFYDARPVDLALFFGHPEVARYLLRQGVEGRDQALAFALGSGDLEMARAAVAGGPLLESTLQAVREGGELSPEIEEILARAETVPDPEPPSYSLEELHRFTGRFEGFSTDDRAQVALAEGELLLWIDDQPARALEAIGERSFRSTDGEATATFFGRAGTIEGIALRLGAGEPVSLRRSVAEPVAVASVEERGAAAEPAESSPHWPAFRGWNAAGIGDGAETPVEWDFDTGDGVLWETDLAGLGNSSPIVWGDRVFVTTAVAEGVDQGIRTGLTGSGEGVEEMVEHSWQVLAFDRRSGKRLWEREVGRGVPLTRRHFKATQANATPATDGRFLVAVFPTAGVACLDMQGRIVWKHELGGLNAGAFTDPGQEWGFASSPVIHGQRAILQVDVHGGQYLVAWDLETGREVWRTERSVAPSWATPTLLAGPEGDELVVNGSTIHGYDLETGRELWSLGPNSELVIATPVASGGVAYVSAGYPPVKPIYAVRAGTRGDLEVEPGRAHERLVWSHERGGAYLPTPLLYRGRLYVVHHNGRLVVYEAESGTPIQKSRFSQGGTFTGSPVAANGKLYLPTEEGLLYVMEAGAEARELAVNDFGEPLMATPAISEGVLFVRTPTRLVALGERAGGESGQPPATPSTAAGPPARPNARRSAPTKTTRASSNSV